MEKKLLETIEKNKIILVLSEKELGYELEEALDKKAYRITLRICGSHIKLMDNVLDEKKPLCLVDRWGEDGQFENIFIRYRDYNLEAFTGKIIVLCRYSLLSHYRDPSLYFVPIKNHRLQKQFFAQYDYQVSHEEKCLPQSKLFWKKEIAAKKVNPEDKKQESKTLRDYYLNQKFMTSNAVMMSFLADRILENETYKAFLFQLIYSSRADDSMQVAAANAITGLNYARVSFSGMDLSRIKIPKADLSQAILDTVNLSYADLTNSILKDAWLRNTNLRHTCLEGVCFGENSHIYLKESVSTLDYIHDENLLLTIAHYYGESEAKFFFWSTESKILIKSFVLRTPKLINCVAYYSDTKVATGHADGEICLWDLRGNRLLINFFDSSQSTIEFPVKTNLPGIVVNADGTIETDSEDENDYRIREISIPPKEILYLGFNPEGTILFSLQAEDKKVKIWTLETGQLLASIPKHENVISGITHSSDKKRIAFSSWVSWGSRGTQDTMSLFLLSVENLYHIHTFNLNFCSSGWSPWAYDPLGDVLAFSEDNKILGVIHQSETQPNIFLFNVKNHQCIGRLKASTPGRITVLAISKNNAMIATAKNDNSIFVQEIEKEGGTLLRGHTGTIYNLLFEPSDQNLISSGDETIRFWDVVNLQKTIHSQSINLLAISRDGIGLIKKRNNTLEIWQIDKRLIHLSTLDGQNIVSYFTKKYIDFDQEKMAAQISLSIFSPDNKLVALCFYNYILIFDVKTGEMISKMNSKEGRPTTLGFHPQANILVVATEGSGSLVFWNINSAKRIKRDSYRHQHDHVRNIDFSPNGRLLAVSSILDGTIKVWEIKDSYQKPVFFKAKNKRKTEHTKKGITVLTFSPDGQTLVSGSRIGEVHIWDPETGQQVDLFTMRHFDEVTAISFRLDNRMFASCSTDGTVLIWFGRINNTFQYAMQLEDRLNSTSFLSWHNDGFLITASPHYAVRYWQFIDKPNEQIHCQLFWSNVMNFEAKNCDLTHAVKLTEISRNFLTQQVAVVNPRAWVKASQLTTLPIGELFFKPKKRSPEYVDQNEVENDSKRAKYG